MIAGGAKAAQQYLAAGLVDEMDISLVPILLGGGERLFEGTGDALQRFQLARGVTAPGVTHSSSCAARRRRLEQGPQHLPDVLGDAPLALGRRDGCRRAG